SLGPFGSTCATAACLRHPASAKLNSISAITVLQTESARIRVPKFFTKQIFSAPRYCKARHVVILSEAKNLGCISATPTELDLRCLGSLNMTAAGFASEAHSSVP